MTGVFTLNEPIVKALMAQMEANVVNQVNEINASVTDGFTITPPTHVLDYLPSPAELGMGLPLLAIGDGPSEIVDDLVYSVGGEHILAIEAILTNSDPRTLTWQMRRYLQLIMRLLQVDRTLNGTVWTTKIKGIEPGGIAGPRNPESEAGYLLWNYVLIETPKTEV